MLSSGNVLHLRSLCRLDMLRVMAGAEGLIWKGQLDSKHRQKYGQSTAQDPESEFTYKMKPDERIQAKYKSKRENPDFPAWNMMHQDLE